MLLSTKKIANMNDYRRDALIAEINRVQSYIDFARIDPAFHDLAKQVKQGLEDEKANLRNQPKSVSLDLVDIDAAIFAYLGHIVADLDKDDGEERRPFVCLNTAKVRLGYVKEAVAKRKRLSEEKRFTTSKGAKFSRDEKAATKAMLKKSRRMDKDREKNSLSIDQLYTKSQEFDLAVATSQDRVDYLRIRIDALEKKADLSELEESELDRLEIELEHAENTLTKQSEQAAHNNELGAMKTSTANVTETDELSPYTKEEEEAIRAAHEAAYGKSVGTTGEAGTSEGEAAAEKPTKASLNRKIRLVDRSVTKCEAKVDAIAEEIAAVVDETLPLIAEYESAPDLNKVSLQSRIDSRKARYISLIDRQKDVARTIQFLQGRKMVYEKYLAKMENVKEFGEDLEFDIAIAQSYKDLEEEINDKMDTIEAAVNMTLSESVERSGPLAGRIAEVDAGVTGADYSELKKSMKKMVGAK